MLSCSSITEHQPHHHFVNSLSLYRRSSLKIHQENLIVVLHQHHLHQLRTTILARVQLFKKKNVYLGPIKKYSCYHKWYINPMIGPNNFKLQLSMTPRNGQRSCVRDLTHRESSEAPNSLVQGPDLSALTFTPLPSICSPRSWPRLADLSFHGTSIPALPSGWL